MTVRTENSYFTSTQYNWTGEYDANGKKIPGNIPECIVRGIYHPEGSEKEYNDPFSMIDFTVLPGKEFNQIRFNTVQNVAYITSGIGLFIIFTEEGRKEQPVKPTDSIVIEPNTRYSFKNLGEDAFKGVMVSTPAWFKEDEEYDWDLVREVMPM